MPSVGEHLRISHVITKGDYGGAQSHVVDLALTQAEAGDLVTVIAGTDGPAMRLLDGSAVTIHVVPSLGRLRTGLGYRAAYADIKSALAESAPDVVHAHSSNAGLIARAVGWRTKRPTVYTAHGWPFQRGAARLQRAQSAIAESLGGRMGDAIICLNEAEAALARKMRLCRPGAIHVVPNGLRDVPVDRRRPGSNTGPLRIVMVARFAPPKLQHELVDAVARMSSGDATLTFVGDGPDLDAAQRHANDVLPGRVDFLGLRNDVPDVLARHDVSVLWSRYEGMPISLLESMRAGMACVASDLPGTRALFGAPPSGQVAATPTALVEILDELVDQSPLVDKWGRAARERFETDFSAPLMAERVRRVYASVCETSDAGHL